ncbi:DUF1639 family protein [Quillaja saponaria]|uniref:DUF1639 family protein n=1 Tax=Quillaja saponaria TaxID=32244 RepID=A0AAD7LPN3_QUISA|nr:DUF1639 family protein [Quillaja saponaria]
MVEEPEPAPRAWNLRPRRPVTKPPKANGGVDNPLGQNQPELAPSGGPAEAKVTMPETRQKPKRFSLALTKEEIQEDFFAITGSKPPRRPKRRAKNVQKILEGIFPGMYLMSVTTAAYRVPDPPLKA